MLRAKLRQPSRAASYPTIPPRSAPASHPHSHPPLPLCCPLPALPTCPDALAPDDDAFAKTLRRLLRRQSCAVPRHGLEAEPRPLSPQHRGLPGELLRDLGRGLHAAVARVRKPASLWGMHRGGAWASAGVSVALQGGRMVPWRGRPNQLFDTSKPPRLSQDFARGRKCPRGRCAVSDRQHPSDGQPPQTESARACVRSLIAPMGMQQTPMSTPLSQTFRARRHTCTNLVQQLTSTSHSCFQWIRLAEDLAQVKFRTRRHAPAEVATTRTSSLRQRLTTSRAWNGLEAVAHIRSVGGLRLAWDRNRSAFHGRGGRELPNLARSIL